MRRTSSIAALLLLLALSQPACSKKVGPPWSEMNLTFLRDADHILQSDAEHLVVAMKGPNDGSKNDLLERATADVRAAGWVEEADKSTAYNRYFVKKGAQQLSIGITGTTLSFGFLPASDAFVAHVLDVESVTPAKKQAEVRDFETQLSSLLLGGFPAGEKLVGKRCDDDALRGLPPAELTRPALVDYDLLTSFADRNSPAYTYWTTFDNGPLKLHRPGETENAKDANQEWSSLSAAKALHLVGVYHAKVKQKPEPVDGGTFVPGKLDAVFVFFGLQGLHALRAARCGSHAQPLHRARRRGEPALRGAALQGSLKHPGPARSRLAAQERPDQSVLFASTGVPASAGGGFVEPPSSKHTSPRFAAASAFTHSGSPGFTL